MRPNAVVGKDPTAVTSRQRRTSTSSNSSQVSHPPSVPPRLPGYDFLSIISEGTYATVWKARHHHQLVSSSSSSSHSSPSSDNRLVAIKVLKPTDSHGKSTLQIHGLEHEFLTLLRSHPNIIHLVEVLQVDREIPVLVMELMDTTLLALVQKKELLDEITGRHYFRQLASAVDYAHSKSVIHRDLKLENVLVNLSTGSIRLADWGFATYYHPSKQQKDCCGSLHYCAPEMLTKKPYMGPEVDAWSIGVCLYVMCSGRMPFYDHERERTAQKIREGRFRCPSRFSRLLRDLVYRLIQVNPQDRWTVHRALSHPWLSSHSDQLQPMDPTSSAGSGSAHSSSGEENFPPPHRSVIPVHHPHQPPAASPTPQHSLGYPHLMHLASPALHPSPSPPPEPEEEMPMDDQVGRTRRKFYPSTTYERQAPNLRAPPAPPLRSPRPPVRPPSPPPRKWVMPEREFGGWMQPLNISFPQMDDDAWGEWDMDQDDGGFQ